MVIPKSHQRYCCNAFTKIQICLQGKCLTRNVKQPSIVNSMLDCLWARIIATILFPIHLLAIKFVYSKIHSAIGFSKVLYSLLCFVVKFNIFVSSSL